MSDVPSLYEQEREGLFREEVQKLADGVEADIISGHLKTQEDAKKQLDAAVEQSSYVRDFDLQSVVLQYSRQAKILTTGAYGEQANSPPTFDRKTLVTVCMKMEARERLSRSVHFYMLGELAKRKEN